MASRGKVFEPTRRGHVHTDSWAGRMKHPVEVLGETPKRYRVRHLDKAFRWRAGDVKLVPKYTLTFDEEGLS